MKSLRLIGYAFAFGIASEALLLRAFDHYGAYCGASCGTPANLFTSVFEMLHAPGMELASGIEDRGTAVTVAALSTAACLGLLSLITAWVAAGFKGRGARDHVA